MKRYFNGYIIQNFSRPEGLVYVEDVLNKTNKYIFVADWNAQKLIKFNLNFTFLKSIQINYPRHLTSSFNSIYVTSIDKAIMKYDFDLNLLANISSKYLEQFHGIHYSRESERLYVADGHKKVIHIFDSDLIRQPKHLIHLPAIYNYTPTRYSFHHSINYYSGQLIVTCDSNKILVIHADRSVSIHENICPSSRFIFSTFIFKNKYILVNCISDRRVNILTLNFNQTGKYLSTSGFPVDIISDDERLLVTEFRLGQIEIFS